MHESSQPLVHVNQLGYLPHGMKRASVATPATAPLAWELRQSGAVVASGTTTVFGPDADSGDHIHIVDFSAYATPGGSYSLRVAGADSAPFSIAADIYQRLTRDAMGFFYHNRCGIAIAMPYAGHERWVRPEGHPQDAHVPCAPGTGDYALDVAGGWYDAGDQGKYVVNGGIATWTLQHIYERSLHLGAGDALPDGSLSIPENANGIPDILDETRWEIEFLLKMQVPEGQPLAGMAHHKMHNDQWTPLPTAPHADQQPRILRPPSTAATLNLAAAAAQAARIWREIDPAFAQRCLAAAARAWDAARANPDRIAPHTDGVGGGAYGDPTVDDEFYWAACELFITTGQQRYREFLLASPHFAALPSAFGKHAAPTATWGQTQALGTIALATVPNSLDDRHIHAARAAVVAAADVYLADQRRQGYALVFAPGEEGYPWGSTSFALNNQLVLALAYDLTKKAAYRDAVLEGMDYLLGRNPLGQSYVSGYGTRPLRHPHHRYWADQIDPSFPPPPPGALSGGPDSQRHDPHIQAVIAAGTPGQRCFDDHIASYSTNEVAINWNAPLAWVAAFLAEQAEQIG
ncbi:endoglucanase [Chloroflexia bacterium SDU3-3]|nr:endoglucanase [Chloroflexia bacterium SDU3-3]